MRETNCPTPALVNERVILVDEALGGVREGTCLDAGITLGVSDRVPEIS